MSERLRVIFGGDTAYGENYQARYADKGGRNILKERGYGHCSERVAPLLRRADHVILNLETPLSTRRDEAIEGKAYVHWADPDKSLDALKALNVSAVSLANNHAGDLGARGLQDTHDALRAAGVAGFGAGENAAAAIRAHRTAFEVDGEHVELAIVGGFHRSEKFEDYELYATTERPGVAALDVDAAAAEIGRVRAESPNAFVVAFPHWGYNYRGKTADQTDMADHLLAAGADLILGHGAHRLQEIERRRGRWVVYSLGNFVFNSGGRYAKYGSTPLSLVAELSAERQNGEIQMNLRLYPIYSDNRVTDYQPRLVSDGEFAMLLNALKELAKDEKAAAAMSGGLDEIGWHIHVPISRREPVTD